MNGGGPLPSALYARPEIFARERRSIFTAAWLLLGRRDALAVPGDYIALSLAGWPVFAIRDAAGAIAVCRNVCRHQAMAVLNNGAGNCQALRCRYHGWTYDLAGRFVSAPPQVAPAAPKDAANDLAPVPAASWQGLIFVHLAERAAPPPFDAALDLPPLEAFAFRRELAVDVNANWKLVMEHGLGAAPADVLAWQWPNLIAAALPGGAVLRQVVPRAFQRTQLISHVFVAPGAGTAAPDAAEQPYMAAAKSACEAAQTAHEAGIAEPVSEDARVAAFRERVRAAHPA